MATAATTDLTPADDSDLSIGSIVELLKHGICELIDPTSIISQGASFLKAEDDKQIRRMERVAGAQLLIKKAQEMKRIPEFVNLLERDYVHLYRLFADAKCKELAYLSEQLRERGEGSKEEWNLIELLRHELYNQMDPVEILPELQGGGFLTELEVETIREKHHRFDACIELVATLTHKKQEGAYNCLMNTLQRNSQRELVNAIDPGFDAKLGDFPDHGGSGNVSTSGWNIQHDEDDTSMQPLKVVGDQNELNVEERLPVLMTKDQPVVASIELKLRPYQEEVVLPAIAGHNCIICMPTNSGKTFVAAYIIDQHMRSTASPKVAFMAPRVALINQQYVFLQDKLASRYKVMMVTGDSGDCILLSSLLSAHDVLVLTPQVLENALMESHIESLSKFTLLIFDECHHCIKNDPYRKIMTRYLRDKFNGNRNLPQVLGLSATLGVGDSNSEDQAVEHILQICANLDSHCAPVQVVGQVCSLRQCVNTPQEEQLTTCSRQRDVFSDAIEMAMKKVENVLKQ